MNGNSLTARRKQAVADEERATGNGRNRTGGTFDERIFSRPWHRFTRKGKKNIGVMASFKAMALSSWLNIFIVFIPFSWAAHFRDWSSRLTFVLSFLAIIPLERLFDYGGEQLALYCGTDLGDLIVVTLNNAVEAALAIILLTRCELKLLQSTIIGVIILHLLLIPGVSFITGGARVISQDLHPHLTQLNHSLLTIGVLSLLLPAAFFAALDTAFVAPIAEGAEAATAEALISDATRRTFLHMSHGLAVILLAVYICSRIFLHNPPGEENALVQHPLAPEALKEEEKRLAEEEPEVNQYVLIVVLVISIAIMAATAEWLVESIDDFKEHHGIEEEWFGLILLPIVSFAADGFISIVFFIRSFIHQLRGTPPPIVTLAKARAIDLSIQFTLFWMPFMVLLGWWADKPLTLLFDFFEICALLGATFIVNYVTADAKTNWAEGFAMVSFYLMIALCTWFYTGQPEMKALLVCPKSVAEGLVSAAHGAAE